MKNTKLVFIGIIVVVVSALLGSILYLQWSQYKQEKENDIKERTNNIISRKLMVVEREETFEDFVVGLIDYEYENEINPLLTPNQVINEFLEIMNIEPFTYIEQVEDYKKYVAIFSKIREVIVTVSFHDKDFNEDSIFYQEDGNNFEIDLGNHRYQYQIKKFILSKENWVQLFERYKQARGLKNNFYIEKLWKNSFTHIILSKKNISQETWYKNFNQLYKKYYVDLEPYILEELTSIIIDFCDYILEKEQYKQISLDTILLTYKEEWTNRIPNLEGLGEVYQSKLNIKEIYSFLDSKGYPKLYF